MREDGKKPVSHRFGYEGCLIGALLLPLCLLFLPSAQIATGDVGTEEGFGNLKWGDTVDQALRIYPDLHFEGYRIVTEKQAPYKEYRRKGASKRVDGVDFDSLEYWFRGDRFYEIRAVLSSRIGPRTLVTEAERSFDILIDRIGRAYGKPKEHNVKYVTEYLEIIKEARWDTRGVAILLRYNGAEKGNVDRLTLEIRKQGGVP
jgi:hypothetical protein